MASSRSAGCSTATRNSAYAGQGNHNLSIADVDDDGRQEIIFGAATINDNGTLHVCHAASATATPCTWATSIPSRAGLEIWDIHESSNQPGADLRSTPAPAHGSSPRLTTTAAKARAAAWPRTSGPATPARSTGARVPT